MPSASTNSNNKNKLMKQASFGCSSGSGGGGGGPGGSASTTSTTAVAAIGGPTKSSNATTAAVQNLPSSVSNTAPIEANNINNSNNSGSSNSNTNTESVCSNNTLSSSTGKGGEKSSIPSNVGANMATNVTTNDTGAGNLMRQALIIIEHKIRNLEKRKTKLESYRQIQANGKELSSDQKAAVAKYDAVMATLDFARDLSKQMLQFSKDAEKEQKKQARKDVIAKAQAETAKIREVLVMQNILSCFSDDSVRNDFLNGENGAIKLDSTELDALEQFCFDIQTRRPESADDPSFISIAQKAAEYFSMTIDGRPKQYGETTFENLRRVFNQIQECGYLDKIYLTVSDSSNVECNEDELNVVGDMPATEDSGQRVSNSLEENMEKLNVVDGNVDSNARNTPIGNYVDATELSEQPLVKEQLDQMQKPNAINTISMPSPPSVPSAAAMTGVPGFAGPMPPPQNRQRSGTTTPVHVTAMYAPQAGGPPQPVPPQMQQVVAPTGGALISGLPPQPPTQVAIAAQHRPGSSAVGVQLPPGVSPTMPPPMHGGPPPGSSYPLTTVRAVEQDFFKQHQQQQQKYVQQMRPLAEVIGTGSFFFIQESELDSPEIIGGSANSGSGGSGVVFESQTANMMVHVSDVPLTGAVVDLQQQQQSKKLTSQQQTQPQQQPSQQQLDAQHHTLQQQQQQQLQHQPQQSQQSQLQQQSPQQPQPIPTQTFTNQTFPPIQPQPHTQLQRHETTPTPSAAVVAGGGPMPGASKTPTVNNESNGNTPTAQMFQQPPAQPIAQTKTALYSPDLVMASKNVVQHQQQQQQQIQQQQQPIMIMTRLATPQARLPMQSTTNIPQQQQPPQQQQQQQPTHSPGFPFDPMVASFGGYEQVQQQLAAVSTGTAKLTSGVVPNVDEKSRKVSGTTDSTDAPVVGEWEATIKGHAPRSVVNNNAAKAAALTSALKQHSSGTSPGGNASPLEQSTNKWSTEMNALSGRGNTPPTVSHHNNNQNRKNEWSTAGGNGSGNVGSSSYGNDVVSTHTDNTSNHWNSNQPQQQQQQQQANQQQHENNTGGGGGSGNGSGYVRGGGGGRNSNNAYQRRNDDRGRGDRGTGGTGGGGGNNSYRNRTNNNYGGGGAQSQQQNGSGRGGGIYFRNNENAQSGASNSFYQNGGLYTKDGINGPRYDNGGNTYRGPRGGGNTNQRNQGPPRTIGRNAGNNSGNNTTGSGGGGGNASGSGGGYMHPRQTNRMSLGLEKN